MGEIVRMIEEHGFPWALAVLFILGGGFLLRSYIKMVEADTIVEKAMYKLEDTTDTLSKNIEIQSVKYEMQVKILEMLLDDVRETQQRLYTHDDRLEKNLTLNKETRLLMEQILVNQVGQKEADKMIQQAESEVKNEH